MTLCSERRADCSISQSEELFAKEDSISALETLRTYSGGQVHGSVGWKFNAYSA